jgi:hypothetical protein
MTSLLVEVDGTAECTVSEGTKGGAIFPTSSLLTQRAHNCHIDSNKYFFSSFNLPRCQEWGTMAAMGGRQPPWLACVYFA